MTAQTGPRSGFTQTGAGARGAGGWGWSGAPVTLGVWDAKQTGKPVHAVETVVQEI